MKSCTDSGVSIICLNGMFHNGHSEGVLSLKNVLPFIKPKVRCLENMASIKHRGMRSYRGCGLIRTE